VQSNSGLAASTYISRVSFHCGLRFFSLIVVFRLLLWLSRFIVGINFTFTYGSERPFGSIGAKFFASRTGQRIKTIQLRYRLNKQSKTKTHGCKAFEQQQHPPFTVSFPSAITASRLRRPRFSVWSRPHSAGTFGMQRLWKFRWHAEETGSHERCKCTEDGVMTKRLLLVNRNESFLYQSWQGTNIFKVYSSIRWLVRASVSPCISLRSPWCRRESALRATILAAFRLTSFSSFMTCLMIVIEAYSQFPMRCNFTAPKLVKIQMSSKESKENFRSIRFRRRTLSV